MDITNDKASPEATLRAPAGPAPRTPSPSRSPVSKEFERPSGLCRVFNPPKLEKKHSSGDLISRLKTRKILGVGETDNGDIHRSKISQVLGHNEHLYVRLPRGFWYAHAFIACFVTLEALFFVVTPSVAHSVTLVTPDQQETVVASRITGAALCGLAVVVCSLIGTADKYYAKTVLASIFTYQVMTCLFCVGSVVSHGTFGGKWVKFTLAFRVVISILCIWFFNQIASFSPCKGVRPTFNSFRCSNAGQKEN